mmetsp:Transcript_24800/g.33186  ORF Transcript_24800/g.33186 Transcript_24800/m.33186 type:complete len:109 (-) Transcript_24800:346-672(-)
MGFIQIGCLTFNTLSKYDDETMIFMLNPCHLTSLLQIICCFCPFNYFTESVALTSFAFNFGGWIGLIFTELEGYSNADVFVYFLQHVFTAFLGTIVLSLKSRFDILAY